ncbi:SpoIIE family protein phosphatase [Streptomyces vastus]|uniref:SpoIIE family protein phosphatase n=1 Tax=Streptomyces vastus TaxID=285451 RepID=UPI0031E457B8
MEAWRSAWICRRNRRRGGSRRCVVSGRGAPAAALTSLIRYTLRSTALLERDPCAVLRALNSALLSASSDGSRFCT